MTVGKRFFIRFWGVRGSIPCPGPHTMRYGGNTSCMEVVCGDRRMIIDGGSGLRELGLKIAAEPAGPVDVYFTHTHWDHICGVPFFVPAYLPDRPVTFHAGHLGQDTSIRHVLCEQMMAPLFPVPLTIFQRAGYVDFRVGEPVRFADGVEMNTAPLNHPNGCCGYRIDYAGKRLCVITDVEHIAGEIDRDVVAFCRDADVMVYDAMYTDEEYLRHIGWGHSTWQQALRVAEAANVATTVLFHHDPCHDDDFMDGIALEADAVRPGTKVAIEGMVIDLL